MPHVVMLVTSDLVHDNRMRREEGTLAEAGDRLIVFSTTVRRTADFTLEMSRMEELYRSLARTTGRRGV